MSSVWFPAPTSGRLQLSELQLQEIQDLLTSVGDCSNVHIAMCMLTLLHIINKPLKNSLQHLPFKELEDRFNMLFVFVKLS